MVAVVHEAKAEGYSNTGSVYDLTSYLDKEKECSVGFFTHERAQIIPSEVILTIDQNRTKLTAKEAKFFMLTLNPSQEELCSVIGRSVNSRGELTDEEVTKIETYLRDLTKKAMDMYADQFDRASVRSAEDLLYYARIETKRIYKPTHDNLDAGATIGQEKAGLNYHVHIIVSRKSKDGKVKLSPEALSKGNEWELEGRGIVKRGFSREAWSRSVQKEWYKMLGMHEELKNLQENDSIARCGNADLKVLAEYKFTKASYVLHEMMDRGYKVNRNGAKIEFRKDGKTFDIEARDLRLRESRVSSQDKYNAWKSQKEDTGFQCVTHTFKAKDPRTEEVKTIEQKYFCSQEKKILVGYQDCYYVALTYRDREQILADLPEGRFKELLSTVNICRTDEIVSRLEKEGFKHTFSKGHTFTRGQGENKETFRMSQRELGKFTEIRPETISDIADRFDVKLFRSCVYKENYDKDGISVEKRTYTTKKNEEKFFYLVHDKKTDSVVYLKEVMKEVRARERFARSLQRSEERQLKRTARKLVHKTMDLSRQVILGQAVQGDIAEIMNPMQQVVSAKNLLSNLSADPATFATRKLLDQVKQLLFSSLKHI